MATHSSILAWRSPRTEKPGGLQSMGSQRIRHYWVTNTFTFRVLAENYLKYWETCSVSNRLLTALEDAAMGCSISYKHGDIQVSSLQQAATSKCAAPTAFEWRQGLWPFTFITVTPNNAKEMVLYKHNSPISGCWTFATCLPMPLTRKTTRLQTETL